ncbi:hypothetical protein HU675_0045145 [Bradyrhizobium septentrionale]|uniref:hypothetical protein n=1 Tax=Bradyrhizobium septentrionale TaxID=1404411 RepID=UPI001596FA3C|nr:hypothetical protein [Bradyrhizobium septentrionale]UGY24979.1 hypothetical protein HU675_0045145 [Bradyrhizobium septentrionale]
MAVVAVLALQLHHLDAVRMLGDALAKNLLLLLWPDHPAHRPRLTEVDVPDHIFEVEEDADHGRRHVFSEIEWMRLDEGLAIGCNRVPHRRDLGAPGEVGLAKLRGPVEHYTQLFFAHASTP